MWHFNPLAPRETKRWIKMPTTSRLPNFNPLAPRETKRHVAGPGNFDIGFQSTRSPRDKTTVYFDGGGHPAISIHSLHARQNIATWACLATYIKFQSTRSTRDKTLCACSWGKRGLNFNPLAPRETKPMDDFRMVISPCISIHSLHARQNGKKGQISTLLVFHRYIICFVYHPFPFLFSRFFAPISIKRGKTECEALEKFMCEWDSHGGKSYSPESNGSLLS